MLVLIEEQIRKMYESGTEYVAGIWILPDFATYDCNIMCNSISFECCVLCTYRNLWSDRLSSFKIAILWFALLFIHLADLHSLCRLCHE
jgi:hypothetical protein